MHIRVNNFYIHTLTLVQNRRKMNCVKPTLCKPEKNFTSLRASRIIQPVHLHHTINTSDNFKRDACNYRRGHYVALILDVEPASSTAPSGSKTTHRTIDVGVPEPSCSKTTRTRTHTQ